MSYKKIAKYLKDRDYILANIESISLEEIIEFCKQYNQTMPSALFSNEEYVKGALHKVRLQMFHLNGVTDEKLNELQKLSKQALDKLGWTYQF